MKRSGQPFQRGVGSLQGQDRYRPHPAAWLDLRVTLIIPLGLHSLHLKSPRIGGEIPHHHIDSQSLAQFFGGSVQPQPFSTKVGNIDQCGPSGQRCLFERFTGRVVTKITGDVDIAAGDLGVREQGIPCSSAERNPRDFPRGITGRPEGPQQCGEESRPARQRVHTGSWAVQECPLGLIHDPE